MTAVVLPSTGAPSTSKTWDSINWKTATAEVRRLQMRIAKAYREGRYGKAKAMQWLLTHSFYAKVLAVKRVTQNKGASTPGVDKITWVTPKQKMDAALSLKRQGYKTQPLRRIYIPKKTGDLRPLSIPVMNCRGQQALHLLALDPIAETIADKNTYGFRPLRSTADALEQCFISLSKTNSAQYILEGDIKSCFDTISHSWLLKHVPMDKIILKKWLSAGYMDKGELYSTEQGTPQGGVCSPTLLNITLSGLEKAVKTATKRADKVNVTVYADDFVITGASEEVLMNKVTPVVESFLMERGLVLSKEKTKITHINDGFDFLGVNCRKYNGKLIRKPAKDNVKRFLNNLRETVRRNKTAKTENLIAWLNPKIIGWANYHRPYCSKITFKYVSKQIFDALWRWSIKRHPNKSMQWVRQRYFCSRGHRNWVFFSKGKLPSGKDKFLELREISHTSIRRHIKFRAEATPYDPAYKEYITNRLERRRNKALFRPCKEQWSAWWELTPSE